MTCKSYICFIQIQIFEDLPKAAQEYILFIEETLECKIGIVSVGPSRDQTIYRD